METPTNPLLKVLDIVALAKVAHSQPGVRVMKTDLWEWFRRFFKYDHF